jgi:short-subunit dehydrogenase
VNNAGVMVFGPAEEVPLDDARALFDTNIFGVARMVNAALPHMRAQRSGHIVNVGSIAGSVAVPMNGFYAATKHALVAYSEALRHEVQHLGVRVALVEPGDVRSRLWEDGHVVPPRFAAYESVCRSVLGALSTHLASASDAPQVA